MGTEHDVVSRKNQVGEQMSQYNGKWIHDLLDLDPDHWLPLESGRQLMVIHLTDPTAAGARAGWFGAVEWRYEREEESYAFVNSKSFSEESAINWITRNMDEDQLHPSPWGILFYAKNKRQVQDFLISRRIPVKTSYYVVKPEEEKEMPALARSARERRLEQAQRTIERAQAQIDRLMAMPDEPVAKNDEPLVVYFQKQFTRGGTAYDYAAVKAGDGLWYTTGPRAPKGYRWEALIDWIFEYDEVEMFVAKGFKPLV